MHFPRRLFPSVSSIFQRRPHFPNFHCNFSASSPSCSSAVPSDGPSSAGGDEYDEQSLHEEIPQLNYGKVHDVADRTRSNCAVYGAGLSSTGALAIASLVTTPTGPEIVYRPKRIPKMNAKAIKQVAAGFGFSLFASKNQLFGSGLNNFYQLGGPTRTGPMGEPMQGQALIWHIDAKRIVLPEEYKRIRWISAGRMHSVVLASTDDEKNFRIFCMGTNTHGQCGVSPVSDPFVTHNKYNVLRPVVMPVDDAQIYKVHACLDTTFALATDGRLFAWGLGTDGQLGNGNAQMQWVPSLVGGDLVGERIVHIGGSTDTLLAVSEKGELFVWGQNEYGQLGAISEEPQIFYPTHMPFKLGKVTDAQATGSSCIVCNSDGEVFTWGSQVLGFGPAITRLERPMRLDPPLFASAARDGHRVRRVFAGGCAMGAMTEEGHMFSWGANRHGLLALCHRKHQYFPYQISFAEEVRQASFGPEHSLFVTNRF
ncbi:hypothetical protein niasHT_030879 [Heterodera trifolii]|uniref:Uncharacterized protein n=1 Tax=Heterodera trifolii TaxID=157864 RepID=A0ABD2HXN7_9BILA